MCSHNSFRQQSWVNNLQKLSLFKNPCLSQVHKYHAQEDHDSRPHADVAQVYHQVSSQHQGNKSLQGQLCMFHMATIQQRQEALTMRFLSSPKCNEESIHSTSSSKGRKIRLKSFKRFRGRFTHSKSRSLVHSKIRSCRAKIRCVNFSDSEVFTHAVGDVSFGSSKCCP